ncbi:MAG: hypothetical protein AB7S38_41215 [Vulcanimicrobiota bacterium]
MTTQPAMKMKYAVGLLLALWIGLSASAGEQRLAMVLESNGGVTVRASGQSYPAQALQILPAGAEVSVAAGGKLRLSYLQTRQKETIMGPSKVLLEEGGARKLEGKGSVDREAGAGIELMTPGDARIQRAGGKLQAHLMPQAVAYESKPVARPAVETEIPDDKKPADEDGSVPGGSAPPRRTAVYNTKGVAGSAPPLPKPARPKPRPLALGESTVFSRGEFVMAHPAIAGPYTVVISKGEKIYYKGPSLRPGQALEPGNYTLSVQSGVARGKLEFTILDKATAERLARLKKSARTRDQRLEVLATLMQYGLLEEAISYNEKLVKDYPEADLRSNHKVLRGLVKPK